jgi:threonine/homoserine/homoserine lactone efflux protein
MSLISPFLFGVTIAIAIGPIALLIVRAGIERGFGTAARCGLGAASADLIFAMLAFGAGAAVMRRLETHRAVIESVAAIVLIALGLALAAAAVKRHLESRSLAHAPDARVQIHEPRTEPVTRGYGYFPTLGLTLVNPLTIVFFASFAGQLGIEARPGAVVASAAAIFLGSLVVQLAFAAFGALLHRSIRDRRTLLALNVASGLGIAAFGFAGLSE